MSRRMMMQMEKGVWNQYLTFTADEDGSYVKFTESTTLNAEYSTDKKTWINANEVEIDLNNGDRVFFRGTLSGNQQTTSGRYSYFTMGGSILASGNCFSLLNFKTPTDFSYWFYHLFANCTSLKTPPELPYEGLLAFGSYAGMFFNCINLTYAPLLPSNLLSQSCYDGMFQNCKSIQNITLPAKKLSNGCYVGMFMNCNSLESVEILAEDTSAYRCCYAMFRDGCTSLKRVKFMSLTPLNTNQNTSGYWLRGVLSGGVFVKNKNATWTDSFGDNAIPRGWSIELE